MWYQMSGRGLQTPTTWETSLVQTWSTQGPCRIHDWGELASTKISAKLTRSQTLLSPVVKMGHVAILEILDIFICGYRKQHNMIMLSHWIHQELCEWKSKNYRSKQRLQIRFSQTTDHCNKRFPLKVLHPHWNALSCEPIITCVTLDTLRQSLHTCNTKVLAGGQASL